MATVFFTPQVQYFNDETIEEIEQAAQPAQASQLAPFEIETCMNAFEQFSLTPLTAGDIIDRAIRLYRQHFFVFLRIVLVPSLIAYAGGVLWAVGIRNFSFEHGDQRLLLTLALMASGGLLWLAGKALFLMLLGGASRSLVWHFFNGTPLQARAAYQAVRERWWSLLGATLLVCVLLMTVLAFAYTVVSFALFFYFLFALWLLSGLPQWLQMASHLIFGTVIVAAGACLALFTYARVVCVPQAMMVEGKGVFDALARSFRLAGREIKRIAALMLFQFCVAASLYWLLMIPLGWYGYWNGVEMSLFSAQAPLWFNIAQQTLAQIGEILIAPIVLLGFTLLYLDTRVRKEGFDVELLANRILPLARYGDIWRPALSVGITWTDSQSHAETEGELENSAPIFVTSGTASPVIETITVPSSAEELREAGHPASHSAAAGAEASIVIPVQQPDEFAEVVPLPAALAEPAVQTVQLDFAATTEMAAGPSHVTSFEPIMVAAAANSPQAAPGHP